MTSKKNGEKTERKKHKMEHTELTAGGSDAVVTLAEREAWLARATDAMRPLFAQHGYTVPANIRVSVGFPKGHRGRGQAIGQCWTDDLSDGKVFEIFISPVLSANVNTFAIDGNGRMKFLKNDNGLKVGATLAHEMAHATVGLAHSHDHTFSKCVRAIGLTGKPTATVAGSRFDLEWNGVDSKGSATLPTFDADALLLRDLNDNGA